MPRWKKPPRPGLHGTQQQRLGPQPRAVQQGAGISLLGHTSVATSHYHLQTLSNTKNPYTKTFTNPERTSLHSVAACTYSVQPHTLLTSGPQGHFSVYTPLSQPKPVENAIQLTKSFPMTTWNLSYWFFWQQQMRILKKPISSTT